jgi:hypothetical protein
MGSPEDEPERYEDDEVQHEVTLSRGFWLADTACTQALWQAVTGNNPSRFKDDPRNPVEKVSWDDVQGFLGRTEAAPLVCFVLWFFVRSREEMKSWLEGCQEDRGINAREVFFSCVYAAKAS